MLTTSCTCFTFSGSEEVFASINSDANERTETFLKRVIFAWAVQRGKYKNSQYKLKPNQNKVLMFNF